MGVNVKNKVAIVTGASSGIGLATARLLSKKGAKVVLASRTKAKLEKLSKELPGSFVVATDMTKEPDIKNLIKQTLKKFGGLDILINNAGRGYDTPIEKIETEKFLELIRLDLMGPVIAMHEAIPYLRKNGGAIVNISSGTALMAIPEMSAYSSLKRAIIGISLTAREELKKDKISVSVVYPYITATDFEKNTMRVDNNTEEIDMTGLPDADTAEFAAEKILEAISTGKAEVFAHDWMKMQTSR